MKSIGSIITRVKRKVLDVVVVVTLFCSCRQLFKAEPKQKLKEIPVPPLSFPVVGRMLSLDPFSGRTSSK